MGQDKLTLSYALKDEAGASLGSGALTAGSGDDVRAYQAMVEVPGKPFVVELVARNATGASIKWTSQTYTPQSTPAVLAESS